MREHPYPQILDSPTIHDDGKEHWFVLNFIRESLSRKSTPQYAVDRFNADSRRLEIFAPHIRMMEVVDGKMTTHERPLTYHYVFIRGTFPDVKQLCSLQNGFSFLLDPGSAARYAIVSDLDMMIFHRIAQAYQNNLPFYPLDELDLEDGDEVEIIDGPFAGLRGTFIPRDRSASGNIVVAVSQNLGTVAWNIRARYVRILRFAANSKRQYDIAEAFIPKLFSILRHRRDDLPLTEKEITTLSTFCSRMEAVRADNHKFEAKLLSLLLCAATLLGDTHRTASFSQRLHARRHAVTNPSTVALMAFLEAAPRGDVPSLRAALTLLESDLPEASSTASGKPGGKAARPSRAQTLLLTELRYWNEVKGLAG